MVKVLREVLSPQGAVDFAVRSITDFLPKGAVVQSQYSFYEVMMLAMGSGEVIVAWPDLCI